MHMQMMTHYLSQLFNILVYFQTTFYILFNETVSTFDHLLNLYHLYKESFYIEETFPWKWVKSVIMDDNDLM